MKTPTKIFLTAWTVALLLAASLMTGCSDDTAGPSGQAVTSSDDYERLDFSQPNAGLTVSDEDVAFGDEAFLAELSQESMEESDDPMQADPEVMRLEAMAGDPADSNHGVRPRFTYARIEWGMIHGPDDSIPPLGDCGVLDWSGRISVDRGLLVVRRLIRFESPYDHIIRPRPDRQSVDFISHTGCYFDGLVIQIIERPGDFDSTLTTNTLHINTGPYTQDFPVRGLVGMNESFRVDDQGNSVHLVGYSLGDITLCPRGFLAGRWHVMPGDAQGDSSSRFNPRVSQQIGIFGGPVLNLNGRIEGFMRGGYGVDEDDSGVFAGKYIDRRGHFLAFVHGTWDAAADSVSLGEFQGAWVTANGVRSGVMGGEAFPFPRDNYRGGFYGGRWSSTCDAETFETRP